MRLCLVDVNMLSIPIENSVTDWSNVYVDCIFEFYVIW